jgi:hypothetical protein
MMEKEKKVPEEIKNLPPEKVNPLWLKMHEADSKKK